MRLCICMEIRVFVWGLILAREFAEIGLARQILGGTNFGVNEGLKIGMDFEISAFYPDFTDIMKDEILLISWDFTRKFVFTVLDHKVLAIH